MTEKKGREFDGFICKYNMDDMFNRNHTLLGKHLQHFPSPYGIPMGKDSSISISRYKLP